MFGRGDSGAKRPVSVKKNRRGLFCVKTQADPGARKAFRGASANRFYGCFRSKAAAEQRAAEVARKRSIR